MTITNSAYIINGITTKIKMYTNKIKEQRIVQNIL